ncbi:hypothetical protein KIL84_003911 [Mauremys mutica]|uniref:Uncharacterized protein n=1 Tax=Mauremys mutica TaxID=74926 RepID=A0A9D3WW53_9SAUR|nr:hypothetical protein KIL84_003911 [Mauremys mutica]
MQMHLIDGYVSCGVLQHLLLSIDLSSEFCTVTPKNNRSTPYCCFAEVKQGCAYIAFVSLHLILNPLTTSDFNSYRISIRCEWLSVELNVLIKITGKMSIHS